METSSQITKTSIILTNTDTWDDWLGNIRRLAIIAKIWEYVNPDLAEVPQLTKPVLPTYSQVKANATTFAELTQAEQEEWHRINRQYVGQNDDYKRKRRAIN